MTWQLIMVRERDRVWEINDGERGRGEGQVETPWSWMEPGWQTKGEVKHEEN